MEDDKAFIPDLTEKPRPKEVDELASFFDIDDESEGFDPEKDIEMAKEAGKSLSERTEEITKSLANEEDERVVRGRKIGRLLAEGRDIDESHFAGLLPGEVGPERISGGAEEKLAYLVSARDSLLDSEGRRSITKILKPDELTATEGNRRREGQESLVVLEAALLEASITELDKGNLVEGIENLKRAKPGWIEPPKWFNQPLEKAIEAVDLENEEERQVLSEQVAKYYTWLSLDPDAKTAIEKGEGSVEPRKAMEKMYAKALEAKQIEDRLETERRVQAEKEKYEKAMIESTEKVMENAMKLTREIVAKKGLDRYGQHEIQVSFFDYNSGEQILADWSKAGVDRDKLFGSGYAKKAGVEGRVDVIGRAWLDEDIRSKLVNHAVEKMYSDHGSRSKTDYEEAGEMEKWRGLWEKELEAEVKGQSMGVLLGLMEQPERWNDVNEKTMKQVLKILGEGEVFNKLILGKGELSEVDERLRAMLLEFLKGKQVDKESGDDMKKGQAEIALGRLGNLKGWAREVDVQVLAENLQKQEREEKEGREREDVRVKIAKTVEKGLGMMKNLELTRVELEGIGKLDEVINRWKGMLLEVVEIGGIEDKKKQMPISLKLRSGQLEQVEKAIGEVENKLKSGEGETQTELKQQLKGLQLRQVFLGEIDRLLKTSNSYRGTRSEKRGLRYRDIAAIRTTYFDQVSNPNQDSLWESFDDQARALTKKIDNPDSNRGVLSTAELGEKLSNIAVAEGDILDSRQGIEEMVREIERRNKMVVDGKGKMEKRMEEKARMVARDMVKNKLEAYLRSQNRVSYN